MRADLAELVPARSASRCVTGGVRVVSSERRFGDRGRHHDPACRADDALALKGSIDRIDVAGDGTSSSPTTRPAATGTSPRSPTTIPPRRAPGSSCRPTPRRRWRVAEQPDAVVRAEYSFFAARASTSASDTRSHPRSGPRWRRWLDHVVDGIESGLYPPKPERPTWRSYAPCRYCEPDKLGTAERWGEWDRKRHDPRLQRWFADPDADIEKAATE